MHILLQNQTEILINQFDQDQLTTELANENLYFGAMPMFVASLGRCTYAVLESYSMRLDIPAENIEMKLKWQYGKKPTRISAIEMHIFWQELPDNRLKAVEKAAHICTIHQTIKNCVDVSTKVFNTSST